jgi:hypothetical protein
MSNEDNNITNNVQYRIIDTHILIIIGTFDTQEKAEDFLIDNPIYRRPEIKILPTLTSRDIMSLDYIVRCLSDIYDADNKIWFDNKIVNEIAKDFLEKIDDIRSNKSVKNYIR